MSTGRCCASSSTDDADESSSQNAGGGGGGPSGEPTSPVVPARLVPAGTNGTTPPQPLPPPPMPLASTSPGAFVSKHSCIAAWPVVIALVLSALASATLTSAHGLGWQAAVLDLQLVAGVALVDEVRELLLRATARRTTHFVPYVRGWLPADDAAAACALLSSGAYIDIVLANNTVLYSSVAHFVAEHAGAEAWAHAWLELAHVALTSAGVEARTLSVVLCSNAAQLPMLCLPGVIEAEHSISHVLARLGGGRLRALVHAVELHLPASVAGQVVVGMACQTQLPIDAALQAGNTDEAVLLFDIMRRSAHGRRMLTAVLPALFRAVVSRRAAGDKRTLRNVLTLMRDAGVLAQHAVQIIVLTTRCRHDDALFMVLSDDAAGRLLLDEAGDVVLLVAAESDNAYAAAQLFLCIGLATSHNPKQRRALFRRLLAERNELTGMAAYDYVCASSSAELKNVFASAAITWKLDLHTDFTFAHNEHADDDAQAAAAVAAAAAANARL